MSFLPSVICGELIGGFGILGYFVLWIVVVSAFFEHTLTANKHLVIGFVLAVPVLLILAFGIAPWVCT